MISQNVATVVILLTSSTLVLCQRPSFAGSRPIGFPDTPNRTTVAVVDRFGDDDSTTPRLPIEANGDLELIDRLSKLPVDKQPFWFINWQALEAHRKNPQTHVQRPNGFIDPITPSQNAATAQGNSVQANLNAVSSVSSSGSSNSAPTSSSVQSNANAAIGDRFDSDVTNVKPTSTVANKPGAESTVTAEPYSLQWFVNHYSTTTKKTDAKTSR